jgi:hypothetical protein
VSSSHGSASVAARWTIHDTRIGVAVCLIVFGVLLADPNPNVQAMFPWPGYQQPLGVVLVLVGVGLVYRPLREPSQSGVIAPFVRRNRLGIAVAYFLAGPVVATLLTPGGDITNLTTALFVAWLAGLPLFWFLRGLGRPGTM